MEGNRSTWRKNKQTWGALYFFQWGDRASLLPRALQCILIMFIIMFITTNNALYCAKKVKNDRTHYFSLCGCVCTLWGCSMCFLQNDTTTEMTTTTLYKVHLCVGAVCIYTCTQTLGVSSEHTVNLLSSPSNSPPDSNQQSSHHKPSVLDCP